MFKQKVLDVVSKIPKGKFLAYKEVAEKAGNEKASRAVGNILMKNANKNIPCHRVVCSDGSVGSYNGLIGKDKTSILKSEGVVFSKNGRVTRGSIRENNF